MTKGVYIFKKYPTPHPFPKIWGGKIGHKNANFSIIFHTFYPKIYLFSQIQQINPYKNIPSSGEKNYF